MKPLSRQQRRRICQLAAKQMIAQHAPAEDSAAQRKKDEKELTERIFKRAKPEDYEPRRIIRPDPPQIIIPTPEIARPGLIYP